MLQIRTISYRQRSVTVNHRSLTAYIYHVMIIVTSSFSQKSFINFYKSFKDPFYFIEILLNDLQQVQLFSWNSNTFTKYKKQVWFLFICSVFTRCFVIILCINVLNLSILFHCMWTLLMTPFLLVVSQSL